MKLKNLIAIVLAFLLNTPLFAAEVYLTPEAGGKDYADQGEYKNDWGGAQVIALGNDDFRVVIFKGGLPGAGWDASPKTEIPGKRDGEKIVFSGGQEGWKYSAANGEFTVVNDKGDVYTMKKTVRTSPTLGEKPPAGAVVLYDGANADAWNGGHIDERGFLAGGTTSKQAFGDFKLHVEFLIPFKPLGRGQDRGNSGVYLQNRYEIQVLDSFGLKGENNECGGIYSKVKPAVNMCLPPLTWQTYDIDFTAARFDADGKKTNNAVVTVKQNGVVIHENQEIAGSTGGGKPEAPTPGEIQLQGHGNPVFFRNIWVVEKK